MLYMGRQQRKNQNEDTQQNDHRVQPKVRGEQQLYGNPNNNNDARVQRITPCPMHTWIQVKPFREPPPGFAYQPQQSEQGKQAVEKQEQDSRPSVICKTGIP